MIISFTNRKGGVGKTSCTGNIAHEISKTRSTVVVDFDSQGSVTDWLVQEPFEHELADIMFGNGDLIEACQKIGENLFVLGTYADGKLRDYAEQRAPREPFAASDLFTRLEEKFDVILCDLPPGLGTFEQSVLAASDRAIPVLEAEALAVDGLVNLMQELDAIKEKRRSSVRTDWVILNKLNASYRRHAIYRDALTSQWEGFHFFEIPQSSHVGESQMVHLPLAQYNAGEDRALPAYRVIAENLLEVKEYATV